MKSMKGRFVRPISTILLLNLSGLLSSYSVAQITVAAAADLAPLERPLAKAFGPLRFVLGSSGMLARQIENGAPYDVFLSSDDRYVSDLAASGFLLRDSIKVYATGRLGLWSKDGSIKRLEDIKGDRVLHLAIANPAHAPYGVAARQLLQKQGYWDELQSRVVYGETVRAAIQYVESGNADVVIAAWSLLKDRGAVLLPDFWHSPIRQVGAVVKGTKHLEEGRRFLAFLTGPEGKALLARYGLWFTAAAKASNRQ
jgi:molybdate transport system substrate-binding protein